MEPSPEPVFVHPWLGPLNPVGGREVMGWVDIDPAIRMPYLNGDRDLEIVLSVPDPDQSAVVADHLDRCTAQIKRALDALPRIKA